MTPETIRLVKLISQASGETVERITGRERQRPLPALRWMVGRELTQRGYSVNYASREIGLDHNTLRHGIEQLKIMALDVSWHPEQLIAAEFYRLLDSETV